MSVSHKPQLFPETASDLHALTHNQTNLLLQNSSLKPDDKWQPAKKTFINVILCMKLFTFSWYSMVLLKRCQSYPKGSQQQGLTYEPTGAHERDM